MEGCDRREYVTCIQIHVNKTCLCKAFIIQFVLAFSLYLPNKPVLTCVFLCDLKSHEAL